MALSEAQRAKVRLYLGWPARFFQTHSSLEMAMSALDGTPEHQTQVEALFVSIEDIDTKLLDSHKRLKAVAVGSITLDTLKSEIMGLRMEGRRFTNRLSATLSVPINSDYFGSTSASTSGKYRNSL